MKLKFRILSSIFFLFLIKDVSGSEKNRISVIICGDGDEIYSLFGHAGIRIVDETSDLVYNFGTFDESSPNFVSKFLKGDLLYSLSIENYDQFISFYKTERRTVKEYPLTLTESESIKISRSLQSIYNSSSRQYKYQFLSDNCSTRIYYVLKHIIKKADWEFINEKYDYSYRHCLNNSLSSHPIARLGVNILLGKQGETKTNSASITFLPDSLIKQLALIKSVHSTVPLITNYLPSTEIKIDKKNYYIDIAIILAICTIMIFTHYKSQIIINFFLGLIIIFLMLFSNRAEFVWNYSILIFNPFELPLFFVHKLTYKSKILFSLSSNLIYIYIYIYMKIDYFPLLILCIALSLVKLRLLGLLNHNWLMRSKVQRYYNK